MGRRGFCAGRDGNNRRPRYAQQSADPSHPRAPPHTSQNPRREDRYDSEAQEREAVAFLDRQVYGEDEDPSGGVIANMTQAIAA